MTIKVIQGNSFAKRKDERSNFHKKKNNKFITDKNNESSRNKKEKNIIKVKGKFNK